MQIEDDKRPIKGLKTLTCFLLLGVIGICFASGEVIQEEPEALDTATVATPINSPLYVPSIDYIIYERQSETTTNQNRETEIDNLAYAIIKCESGWDSTAQNPSSTAYGLGQFTDGTWAYVQKKWGVTLDRYNYNDQLYAMVKLLKEEGSAHWSSSKYCWDK